MHAPTRRALMLATPLIAAGLFLLACGNAHGGRPAAAGPFDELAIGRSQRLTLRLANGQEQTLVQSPPNSFPTSPAWSPDGSRIAFVQSVPFTGDTTADWGGDIYVVPASGGTTQLLRKHTQAGDEVYGLAWTPDGAALLLGRHLTIYTNGAYGGGSQEVDRLDLSSGTTSTVAPDGVYPSLSKDGSKLAFLTQDPATGQGGIWVADGSGQNARELVPLGEQRPAILYPRISPNGDAVAFSAPPVQATPATGRAGVNPLQRLLAWVSPRTASAHGLPMDVWRASVADGSVHQLTHLSADDPCVTWSSNESEVAFIATGGLYTVGADGGDLKKIGQGEFNGNVDARLAASR